MLRALLHLLILAGEMRLELLLCRADAPIFTLLPSNRYLSQMTQACCGLANSMVDDKGRIADIPEAAASRPCGALRDR